MKITSLRLTGAAVASVFLAAACSPMMSKSGHEPMAMTASHSGTAAADLRTGLNALLGDGCGQRVGNHVHVTVCGPHRCICLLPVLGGLGIDHFL